MDIFARTVYSNSNRVDTARTMIPHTYLSTWVLYYSYPDNVVAEFVRLAAVNGMDVFRIFDCFNDIESMRVSIDAVRAAGKVAEVRVRVCVCVCVL